MTSIEQLWAGPMVRRVEPTAVTVWLALADPTDVTLNVLSGDGDVLMSGTRATVAVGERLHIVAVTATGSSPLKWGQTYDYQLLIGDEILDCTSICYPGCTRPSFSVVPADRQRLRLFHGSCRSPSGQGRDALTILDQAIGDAIAGGTERPHLFVSTGDLIYADTPSETLAPAIHDVAAQLFGEQPPRPDVADAGMPEYGKRQLLSLAEYCALYLLCLSPSLWPDDVPLKERRYVETLPAVRRAFAHVSTLLMFDDHEVADDWNITHDWCRRVLGSPVGRNMVRAGLSAFALFGGWGNTPERFDLGPGRELLELIDGGTGGGMGAEDQVALDRVLALPQEVGAELHHDEGALDWHFSFETPGFDVAVLDVRTMRSFHERGSAEAPDMLSTEALARQIPGQVSGKPLIAVVPTPPVTPPLTWVNRIASRIGFWFAGRGKDPDMARMYLPDRGDVWQLESPAFAALVSALAKASDQVVLLSGDVHVGYTARIAWRDPASVLVQMVSSGLVRETGLRRWRHRAGHNHPWPWSRLPGPARLDDGTVEYLRSERDRKAGRELVGHNHLAEVGFDGDHAVHEIQWRGADDTVERAAFHVPLGSDVAESSDAH